MKRRENLSIQISGGFWWCEPCQKNHCEGGGCPVTSPPIDEADLERRIRKLQDHFKGKHEDHQQVP